MELVDQKELVVIVDIEVCQLAAIAVKNYIAFEQPLPSYWLHPTEVICSDSFSSLYGTIQFEQELKVLCCISLYLS